ncbi:MAG TPA: peptidoglycan recognition family protein [Gaiellaceae bacterium]
MTALPRLVERFSPNWSSRQGARVRLFVWHSTIGSYLGAVAWLCNPVAQASANVVEREDGQEATQLVGWNEKAWHVAAYNRVAEGNEMAGPPHTLAQLRTAACICADRLKVRRLPPRYARFGIGVGFTRHRDLGAKGGGHHDPVLSPAQWRLCCRLTKLEYLRLPPRIWGRG